MSVNLQEYSFTSGGKWEVHASSGGPAGKISEHTQRAEATEAAINYKADHPDQGVSVFYKYEETVYVVVVSV